MKTPDRLRSSGKKSRGSRKKAPKRIATPRIPGESAEGRTGDPSWVYGVQPVLELLQSRERPIEKIWIAYGRTGAGVARIQADAREQRIRVSRLDRTTLDGKIGTTKHQGVVALCSPVHRVDLHRFLERLPEKGSRFLALLDGIQDPHNLGAIVRSACAALTCVSL